MLMEATVLADVCTRIAVLFVELPMLTGFSVQDCASLARDRNNAPLDAELCIADVAVEAWPGFQAGPAVYKEIAQALLELLREHPESSEALRGRTFARTFH
jgi:hypothetical protein